MEYILKNNLPLVNQWTQDIWTKFCAWLMDESEPDAIVLEEGGKPTKDDPAKPMEPPFNAAAMRKAMLRIKNVADDYEQCATKAGALDTIYDLACAALTAPPRNCDRFNTGDLEKDAQDAMEAMLDEGVAGYRTMAKFLLSPVTEQKGESDGGK